MNALQASNPRNSKVIRIVIVIINIVIIVIIFIIVIIVIIVPASSQAQPQETRPFSQLQLSCYLQKECNFSDYHHLSHQVDSLVIIFLIRLTH